MNTRILFMLAATVLLTACATTAPPPEQRHPDDPWEPFNRNMYQFNRSLDRAILRPLARAYDKALPRPVKTGIGNAFDNLSSLPTIVNLVLQGRPIDARLKLERFLTNTVGGLGGFFDVASAWDMPDFDEDFGQTLAVWGWDDSRYLVLPLLGPSTVRDGLGRIPDRYIDVPWREVTDDREWLIGIDVIQQRAALLPRDRQLEDALDEYLLVRDAWLQRRQTEITGQSELPDYDAFLEEDWDDTGYR